MSSSNMRLVYKVLNENLKEYYAAVDDIGVGISSDDSFYFIDNLFELFNDYCLVHGIKINLKIFYSYRTVCLAPYAHIKTVGMSKDSEKLVVKASLDILFMELMRKDGKFYEKFWRDILSDMVINSFDTNSVSSFGNTGLYAVVESTKNTIIIPSKYRLIRSAIDILKGG